MPSIEQCKSIITKVWGKTPEAFFILHGKPGCGKSTSIRQITEDLGIPPERGMFVHINNHEVVDFTGVPSVEDGFTQFNPTKMFWDFREGTGPGVIVLEELAQATTHHQTWAAGFVEERETPQFRLDPQVRVIATANRVEDKSGAKQLLGHLNDRGWHLDAEDSLDDWCSWAMDNGVDPLGIAFLRLRPGLLNDFDPNRRSNPTQRSWTKLFLSAPDNLTDAEYLYLAEGKVGEGAAAEWVAARGMMRDMPSVDAVRLHPETTEVPEDMAVRYAIATALSMTAEVDSFERDMLYIDRMPREYQMVYVTDVVRLLPKLLQNKTFISWAIANKDIFMGSE